LEEEIATVIQASTNSKGCLIKDRDAVSQLKEKGYGNLKKTGLQLTDYEMLYMANSMTLEVIHDKKNLSFNSLVETSLQRDPFAWTKFLIYRDLRSRGYVPREGFGFGADFRVYGRGEYRKKAAKYVIFAMNEGTEINIEFLANSVKDILKMGKTPIIAVVERRGEVIYYTLSGSKFKKLK
tara:strand:- start:65 stop:607 length:543 start_codon:yes stop_codon:yes gene_type:complete